MSLDMKIVEYVYRHLQNPLFDRVMPFVSRLGNGGLIWIGIAAVFLMSKKYRKTGIMVICSMLVGAVIGEVMLKNIIQRARPFVEMPYYNLLIDTPKSFSFPSGHTTSSFAVLGTVVRTVDNRLCRGAVALLAFSIAFSRLYLLVHYPTDILGGIALGLMSSYIVYKWNVVEVLFSIFRH
ncbi:MAG: hypothetical protein HPY66_0660 [Firmicutes bacterium]|nr:hypothetical protein [Bacillota bacterium]MDI6706848.1 phosphatase PAP2 family protein [Bacillota bacterium]